jgi:hypothetical protein
LPSTLKEFNTSHRTKTRETGKRKSILILSTFSLFVQKSSQFQEAENQQTEPEINQGSEVKLERVMLGGLWQIGIEAEIQAIAKQNGDQVFEPSHRYGLHLGHPA